MAFCQSCWSSSCSNDGGVRKYWWTTSSIISIFLASNGFLFPNSRTLQPLSSEGSNTCCTSSTAKFSAEIAFGQSARISSVPNGFAVNNATSSALSASGEGAHASITLGTVHRIMWEGFGDWNVSPVLHRMEIWRSICLRIFLRVC